MIVSHGLFNAPNNHPLSPVECQECIQRETKERYITDMEIPKLLLHSWLHCFLSLASNPTIYLSFLPSFPPASPPLSPLVGQWHTGYGACACAVVYKQDVTAIRRNPICSGLCSQRQTTRGDGKNLMGQVDTHTRIYTHTVLEQICTTSQGKQFYAHIQNHVFSLAMDKS